MGNFAISEGKGEKQGMGMEMMEMEKEKGRRKIFPYQPWTEIETPQPVKCHSQNRGLYLPVSIYIYFYLNIHKSPYLSLHPSQILPKFKSLIKEERQKISIHMKMDNWGTKMFVSNSSTHSQDVGPEIIQNLPKRVFKIPFKLINSWGAPLLWPAERPQNLKLFSPRNAERQSRFFEVLI